MMENWGSLVILMRVVKIVLMPKAVVMKTRVLAGGSDKRETEGLRCIMLAPVT